MGRRGGGAARLGVLAEGAGRRLRAADDRTAARSSGSTSTPPWRGRPTTGWAWPRRRCESSRYLARELGPRGIRCNLVAAGPVRTMAAKSIPGFAKFEDVWADRAPLGWDVNDSVPVAKACVALLSDWFPATTGEMVHVDGGFHSTGARRAVGHADGREPARRRDVAVPAPAPRQPGRLVPVGAEAFAAAAQRDVPVLLSVGYSACHWCHVMAHESFEDPASPR